MSSAKWRPFCLGLNVLTLWLLNKKSFADDIPMYSLRKIKFWIPIQISQNFVPTACWPVKEDCFRHAAIYLTTT